MLENLIESLNDISKCRYTLGGSYGRVSLQKMSMECTGISMISEGNTKKELYYQLQTLFNWKSAEKRSKMDYIKNCTHHDVFNLHSFDKNEKRDESHIRDYERKGKTVYECITCKKQVSKDVWTKSHIPKDVETLRKMRFER
jgi:hypothetical protein